MRAANDAVPASAACDLSSLDLSREAVAQRVRSIGGSDANTIMNGRLEWIRSLWEQKTGRVEPDDLSGNLAVTMGSFTEPLNAAWFQRETGLFVSAAQTSLTSDDQPYRTATLDGLVSERPGMKPFAIFEAKHVGEAVDPVGVLRKYRPQMQHNMDVAGLSVGFLSVLVGNRGWFHHRVESSAEYGAALLEAEWRFWIDVQGDTLPGEGKSPSVPAEVERWAEPIPSPTASGHSQWRLWTTALLSKVNRATTPEQLHAVQAANADTLRLCPSALRLPVGRRFVDAGIELGEVA